MKRIFTNSPTDELLPWETVGEEEKIAGKFGVTLIKKFFRNPHTSEPEEFWFCRKNPVDRPGYTVLPILENGNLLITRTFKHGVDRVVWEFPAGFTEKGVTADALAPVKLSEESGLSSDRIIPLGVTIVAPRKYDTYEALFVALGCQKREGGPQPKDNNILELWELSAQEFWTIVGKADGFVSGFSEMAAWRAAALGYLPGPAMAT